MIHIDCNCVTLEKATLKKYSSIVKMEVVRPSETSVNLYQATRP